MSAQAALREILATGLSKSELHRRSGVSRALIDDYLNGKRQPSLEQLARLGRASGLTLEISWRRSPQWAAPSESMKPTPLTMEERAQATELVCAAAMELPSRRRGDLEFPPFHTLQRREASP